MHEVRKLSGAERQKQKDLKPLGIIELPALGCNYWSIPKCGNTSIKAGLLKASGIEVHSEDNEIYAEVHQIGIAKFIDKDTATSNGFFNLTVVRNPVDRALSMFKDFTIKRKGKEVGGSSAFISEWQCFTEREPDFSGFIDLISRYSDDDIDMHFRAFAPRLTNDDKQVTPKVLCLEDISRWLPSLNKKLKATIEIPHLHQTEKSQQIHKHDKDKLRQRWPQDFALWAKHKAR